MDEHDQLWIAKFPGRSDSEDMGAWESVAHELAGRAGVVTPEAQLQRFGSKHATFLSKRFDRKQGGRPLHFAAAMTLLERSDGADADDGANYLELAELLIRQGARTQQDLEQLWRRVVLFICLSNTDDHLRNHGFMLTSRGWTLAPAYDVNPDPHGEGLKLNISESDNAQDLELAMSVAPYFRLKPERANAIALEVVEVVKGWREVGTDRGLSPAAQDRMKGAFRIVDAPDTSPWT